MSRKEPSRRVEVTELEFSQGLEYWFFHIQLETTVKAPRKVCFNGRVV